MGYRIVRPPMTNVNHRAMWQSLMRAWNKGPACQLEAAARYTRAFPESAYGWIVLADGLAGVARYVEAQEALRRAARFLPKSRRWFLAEQWGHLYKKKHDERRAETCSRDRHSERSRT